MCIIILRFHACQRLFPFTVLIKRSLGLCKLPPSLAPALLFMFMPELLNHLIHWQCRESLSTWPHLRMSSKGLSLQTKISSKLVLWSRCPSFLNFSSPVKSWLFLSGIEFPFLDLIVLELLTDPRFWIHFIGLVFSWVKRWLFGRQYFFERANGRII